MRLERCFRAARALRCCCTAASRPYALIQQGADERIQAHQLVLERGERALEARLILIASRELELLGRVRRRLRAQGEQRTLELVGVRRRELELLLVQSRTPLTSQV